jgi:hypothetical protein
MKILVTRDFVPTFQRFLLPPLSSETPLDVQLFSLHSYGKRLKLRIIISEDYTASVLKMEA